MRAMRLNAPGAKPVLSEHDVPVPDPQPGEVLVRVYAAGVTPSELIWYPTTHDKNGEARTGAVPVHEFSGEIADTGEEVYGMNDWFADGALAEYCITRPEWIAPKPRSLTHAAAATVPIAALTAWQGLYEKAGLQAGERVLIHGGAGAVGVFAIQLARLRGAHVIATVSAHNVDFVRGLGAQETLDYRAVPFEQAARGIDVVFDAVGGETLRRSWSVLGPRGRLVTVAAGGEPESDSAKGAFFIVQPRREQLVEIARWLDAGDLRAVLDGVIPLEQASDAYEGKAPRTGRGRLVVTT